MLYYIFGLFILFFGSVSLCRRYCTFLHLINRYLHWRLILVLLLSLFLFLELFLYLEDIGFRGIALRKVSIFSFICFVIDPHVCYLIVLCLPEKERFTFLAKHQSNIRGLDAIHTNRYSFPGGLEEL